MPARIEDKLGDPFCVPSKGTDQFHTLVCALSQVLGPSAGIDSEDINPKDLEGLMKAYVSNEEEWIRYALKDSSRAYTRNLVDRGNGRSNLVG